MKSPLPESRNLLLFMLGVVLFPGMIALPALVSRSSTPAAEAAKPDTPPAPAEKPTRELPESGPALLAAFLGRQGPPPKDPAEWQHALSRSRFDLRVLLATVPEPNLGFDGVSEAITHAMEAAGYRLDRFSLPRDKAGSLDLEGRAGVLLFVRVKPAAPAAPAGRLVLVYLIGERPTQGVYKNVLLSTLREVQTLPVGARLPLLGPSFSGAALSLRLVLDEAPAALRWPALHFQVISGRATGDIAALLRSDRIDFHTTTQPDARMAPAFYQYLQDSLGVPMDQVALITEGSTAYGYKPPDPPAAQKVVQPRLVLPVPLHVSRLHRALKPGPRDSKEEPILHGEILDRADVPPAAALQTVDRVERSLAAVLTAIFQEKVRYVGLLATDTEDKLFLAASVRQFSPDVQLFTFESDLLFTRRDQRQALQGMLVVSSYPLFTRNQFWTQPTHPTQPSVSWRRQFSGGDQVGVFNATLALLGDPAMQDNHDPPEGLALLEYRWPFLSDAAGRGTGPPIWVTAVGSDGLFPVAVLPPCSEPRCAPDTLLFSADHLAAPARSAPWRFAPYAQGMIDVLLYTLLAAALCLGLGYLHVFHGEQGGSFWRRHFPSFVPCAPLGEAAGQRASRRRQAVYLGFCLLPLGLLLGYLAAIHFLQLRNELTTSLGAHDRGAWFALGLGALAMTALGLLLVCAVDLLALVLCPCWWARRQRIGAALRTWPLLSAGGLVALGLGLTAAVLHLAELLGVRALSSGLSSGELATRINVMLFLRRSAQTSYGLSPVLPLLALLAPVSLWGYYNLRRLRLLLEPAALPLLRHLRYRAQIRLALRLSRLRMQSVGWRPAVAAAALWGACTGLVFWSLTTLDFWGLHVVFRLLFGAGYVAIAAVLLRFVLLWQHLRVVLFYLHQQDLVSAFGRLPQRYVRPLGAQLLQRVPEEVYREELGQHQRLAQNQRRRLLPQDLAPLLTRSKDPQALQRDLDALEQDGVPQDIAAEHAARVLRVYWRERPLSSTDLADDPRRGLAEHEGKAPNASVSADGLHRWLFLLEELLALHVIGALNRHFPHLRDALYFMTASMLLLLAALGSYPFQPQRLLSLWLWCLVLGVVVVVNWIFVQMNRDEILSLIARTPPGQVTWDRTFLSQVLIYGVVPVLTLVMTQFPELRGAFSWLDAMLKTIR